MKVLGVVVTIMVVGGGGWVGYSKYIAEEPGGAFVVKPLQRGDIVQTVSATGTVEPVVKVIVGSQVSGTILKWHADFNDRVTTGFVLAEIDPDRFETALAQAEADLAIAKANEEELRVRYKDAERERKRILGLRRQNNASENELLIAQAEADAAHAALKGTTASVQSAEARLGAARVDLEYTIIRSPIEGVVISRNIDVGQTVAASFQTPELFVIANDLTRMQVNANVSESDIGLIAEGMPAQFRVDAYPRRTFSGTISQIRYNATILDGVVTYVTLIEVPNDDLALRPGMTANVTFEVARAENVVRLPTAALRFNPAPPSDSGGRKRQGSNRREPTVYVLEDDRPVAREVKVGLSDGAFTELISADVTEGSSVITERNWRAGGGRKSDITRSLRRGR